MYERTITIGSAGKTFSVTGWKTGWAYGPPNLLKNLQVVHQNSIYTCTTPVQVKAKNSIIEFKIIIYNNFYGLSKTFIICRKQSL